MKAKPISSDADKGARSRNRSAGQLAGLILWRAGLLLIAGWSLYESLKRLFALVDFPAQVEVGMGLCMAGATFVIASYILEQLKDYQVEGDLKNG
jgi:hypothetical protein